MEPKRSNKALIVIGNPDAAFEHLPFGEVAPGFPEGNYLKLSIAIRAA